MLTSFSHTFRALKPISPLPFWTPWALRYGVTVLPAESTLEERCRKPSGLHRPPVFPIPTAALSQSIWPRRSTVSTQLFHLMVSTVFPCAPFPRSWCLPAGPRLIKLCQDHDREQRLYYAGVYGLCGPGGKTHMPALIFGLPSPQEGPVHEPQMPFLPKR